MLCWNKGVCPIWKPLPGNSKWKYKLGSVWPQSFLLTTDENQNKDTLDSVKSVGLLPLMLQKAKFSFWQKLSRAQFHLCADSPTCWLPQWECNFQVPGERGALASWHLEKPGEVESNCMVLPWASNQLPLAMQRHSSLRCSYYILQKTRRTQLRH